MKKRLQKETNIYLVLALVVSSVLLLLSGASSASVMTQPRYASPAGITVDGNTGDWDVSLDFFADMYRAGDATKKVESKLYLRYDCNTHTMYALVLTDNNIPGLKQDADSWISIGSNSNKVVHGPNDTNGAPPDFAYVGTGFDGDPTHVRGYEASFNLAEGDTRILAHLQVFDDGESQTSALDRKTNKDGIALSVHCVTEVKASVGDYLWIDTNKNGQQDGTESALAGVTVELFSCEGSSALASVTTGADGSYSFGNLTAGSYKIKFTLPSGYVFTTANSGNDATDSDANAATGFTDCFTLAAGDNNMTIDAGAYVPEPPKASVGDYLWIDTNKNGQQDGTESALAGVTVELFSCEGSSALASVTTGADGSYSFGNLTAGSYKIKFTLPSGYVFTTANSGNDATDSDANAATGFTDCFTLAAGDNNMTIDAGAYVPEPPKASVGDYVWHDINRNGEQDGNDAPLANVLVELLDAQLQVITTTTTNGSGYYLFDNLQPGEYYVRFATPSEMIVTKQNGPGNDAKDSDPDPLTGITEKITLNAGETNLTVDAGFFELASVGNYIWEDIDEDGIQDQNEPGVANVKVQLLDKYNNILFTTFTNNNGLYVFRDLYPDRYNIRIILPDGFSFTQKDMENSDELDSDVNPATGRIDGIMLPAGKDDRSRDAGLIKVEAGRIGDYVWFDANRDAQQDASENGIEGITLELYDQNRHLLQSTKTDAQGGYLFVGLSAGKYLVTVDESSLPHDYYRTTNKKTFEIDLDQGEAYLDADFGYSNFLWSGCRERVTAWYEPWYGSAESDSSLRHWLYRKLGGQPDTSLFALYDSHDAKTWEYDILLAWASGLDAFVVDWYGQHSYENIGLKGLLNTAEALHQKYAGYGFAFQIVVSYNEKSIGDLNSNFIYLADSILTHPAYFGTREQGRHPVYIFDHPDSIITYEEYRVAADAYFPDDVFLVWNGTQQPIFKPMDVTYPWVQNLPGLWDDTHGSKWGEEYLEQYFHDVDNIPKPGDLLFVSGAVWPGYDDREWLLGDDNWMSRFDTLTYKWSWDQLNQFKGSYKLPWILVQSWNDLNRSTHIEPSLLYGYKFIVETRDHIYQYVKDCDPRYIDNLGLLVPQHIRQARMAALLYPQNAGRINALLEQALVHFFLGEYLQAISLADEAAGLTMSGFSIDQVGPDWLRLSWTKVPTADGYVVYYAYEEAPFLPAAYTRPDSILVGDVANFTLTGLVPDRDLWISVIPINSNLGPYANYGWFENSLSGAHVQMTHTLAGDKSNSVLAELYVVSGSPTYSGEGWDNAIDGDLEGWDGTVSTRGEPNGQNSANNMYSGPAWAVFSFTNGASVALTGFTLQTDNGVNQGYVKNRWARKIEILTSTTGLDAEDFTSVLTIQRTDGAMHSYMLPAAVTARYVKLVITEPNNTSGNWRQIVEFGILTAAGLGKRSAGEETNLPVEFSLWQNYPNPFNATTSIRYDLPVDDYVHVQIYDLQGRVIATLVDGHRTAGTHQIRWDAANYASGTYFIMFKTGSIRQVKRMLLLK